MIFSIDRVGSAIISERYWAQAITSTPEPSMGRLSNAKDISQISCLQLTRLIYVNQL